MVDLLRCRTCGCCGRAAAEEAWPGQGRRERARGARALGLNSHSTEAFALPPNAPAFLRFLRRALFVPISAPALITPPCAHEWHYPPPRRIGRGAHYRSKLQLFDLLSIKNNPPRTPR